VLFADGESGRGLMPFLQENWLLLLPPALGFAAIYFLLPKARRSTPLWGGALAAVALILGAMVLIRTTTATAETILFYAFSGLAILSGGMMITQKNPVHAALSFALVVLSTCGLFLLQAAPFLMAATIIIYAGAIVVTFLFVIMLAQQEGPSNADSRSREPFLASLAGCVLLASLVCVLSRTYETRELDGITRNLKALSQAADDNEVKRILGDPATFEASDLIAQLKKHSDDPDITNLNVSWMRMKVNPQKHLDPLKKYAKLLHDRFEQKSQSQGSLALFNVPGKARTPGHTEPGKLPASNVAAIGRTLFTDYLVPVEMAATLLLVATIGAIVIAGRKSEELR
jgi:NADH:ubiquinone oxidoreductase subunit 6 (subunit J)